MKNVSSCLMVVASAFLIIPVGVAAQGTAGSKPTASKEQSKTKGSEFQNREGGTQGPNRPYGHTVTEIQSKGSDQAVQNPQAGGQQPAISMSDAEVLAVVKNINAADKSAGELSDDKAQNESVRAIGNQAEKDNGDLGLAISNIEKKANITAKENELSQKFKKMNEDAVAQLKKLENEKFDLAYLDHEIQFHKQALQAIDQNLLPNARNKDLKTVLTKTRLALVQHLQHAEYTQNTLKHPTVDK